MTHNSFAPAFPLLMPATLADGVKGWSLCIELPAAMCPRSGNPLAGSQLTLTPITPGMYPEVYAVAGCATESAQELIGGFLGDEGRPAVRDMEGAVAHIVRAVAQMLRCPIEYQADLVITVQGGRNVRLIINGEITL